MNVLSAPERRSLVSSLAADDPALRDRLTERLRCTEQRLQERTARTDDPRVAELVGHLVATGGKRLRPLLVLLGDGELRDLVAAGPAAGTWQHRRALELLQDSAALAAAGAMMYDRLALARTALTALPQTPALRVLDALCDFVAHRTG
ncbi:hypothetical protein [Streptomyces sp. NBC_01618]|uniref:hypothetical protein n=1 Tax=Streptomyces sp. NBC_01618 TaxID=2975900 RepID=UPI00386AA003|nr:hypothetical protein OH735_23625 [Streptomyces sp. NBC_01618]